MNVLQDIWIINDAGIVVFHRTFDKNLDEQLFGGLLSAINSFAEEITKGGLNFFELADRNYTVIKKNTFLFVANASKKVKSKKMSSELKIIADIFFNLYGEELLNSWDSDVSIFSIFEKEIETSLEQTVVELQRAFW